MEECTDCSHSLNSLELNINNIGGQIMQSHKWPAPVTYTELIAS